MHVNRSPTSELLIQNGLCQGDFFDPFLFTVVTEGLNGLMNEAMRHNLFSSFNVGKKEVKINLLQYVDDTIFICDVSLRNVITMKIIMRSFELASRLKSISIKVALEV